MIFFVNTYYCKLRLRASRSRLCKLMSVLRCLAAVHRATFYGRPSLLCIMSKRYISDEFVVSDDDDGTSKKSAKVTKQPKAQKITVEASVGSRSPGSWQID